MSEDTEVPVVKTEPPAQKRGPGRPRKSEASPKKPTKPSVALDKGIQTSLQILSVEEVAGYLQTSTRAVMNAIKSGDLKAVRLVRGQYTTYRVTLPSLQRWIGIID